MDEYTHLMENAIYNELRHRGFAVDTGVIGIREYIGGKRECKQLEIDFIASKGDSRYYSNRRSAWTTKKRRNGR